MIGAGRSESRSERGRAPRRANARGRRSSRSRIRRLALLIGGLASAAVAGTPADFSSAPPFSLPVATLLEAAEAAAAETPRPIVVLWTEVEFRFDEAGRASVTRRFVYRIASNRDLGDWGVVAASWAPWYQERPVLAARVVTPAGVERRLDPAAAVERTLGGDGAEVFTEDRQLEAPLPGLAPGAVVEETTTVVDREPYFGAGRSYVQPLPSGAPIRAGRVVLSAPISLVLRWRVEGDAEVEVKQRVEGDRRVVELGYGPLEPFSGSEPGLPGDVAPWPLVRISAGGSWNDVASAYAAIVDRVAADADLGAWVERRATPPAERDARIAQLLARLRREIRYTGLELGEGGIVPRRPGEVLSTHFGDCKDQATLLVALLEAAGIPADVALLSSGPGLDVSPETPGLGEFDHAIVHVPGSPELWIDPTDPYSPLGELPVEDQRRWALIANRATRELVRTPGAGVDANRWIESREIRLAERGKAEVLESSEYTGSWAAAQRADYAGATEERIREVLTTYVEDEYGAEQLAQWRVADPADLTGPWRIDLRAAGAVRGSSGEDDAAVALFPAHLLRSLAQELAAAPDGEAAEPRVHDLEIVPFRVEWRYRIVPAPGFRVRELPEPAELAMGPGRHWREFVEGTDGVVTGVLGLELRKRRWSAEEVEAFRAARADLEATPAQLVLFDRTSSRLLADGRVVEAIRELRRLIELHPGEALHRSQLALAVLAGGLGDLARAEARAAAAASPDDAFAHRSLAWVLQHDAWGRRHARGADRAGAIAAYRRAVELDPEDKIAWGDLAILLEHDERGGKYSPGSDLEESVRIYRHLRDALEFDGLDVNLALDLFHLGRDAELIDLAATASVPLELELAALVSKSGVERAMQVARRKAGSASDRAAAVGAAAQHLLGRRLYPQAAELLRSGAGERAGAEQLAALSLIARARPMESIPSDPKDPRDLFRRTLALALEGEPSSERVRELLSRRVEAVPDELDAEQVRAAARAAASAGLPIRAALDLGLAGAETVVDGDEATGYRIRVSMSAGNGGSSSTRAFALVEDGVPRLIGSDEWDENAAEFALERVEAGDLATARTWLDWLTDDKPAPREGDPLSGAPVLRLWPAGTTLEARAARLAALALLAEGELAPKALPALEAELAGARERERAGIEHAIVAASTRLRDDERALVVLETLAERFPDADSVFQARVGALGRLRRWSDADQVIARRLAADPDDPLALRLRAQALGSRGELAAAADVLEQLERRGHASSNDLNTLAWLGLFLPDRLAAATGRAERAARETGFGSYAVLNTLAALYARTGRTADALQVWRKSLERAGDRDPAGPDLFVLGQLAESYELDDAARELYRRAVVPAEAADPLATSRLAEQRLRALGGDP